MPTQFGPHAPSLLTTDKASAENYAVSHHAQGKGWVTREVWKGLWRVGSEVGVGVKSRYGVG